MPLREHARQPPVEKVSEDADAAVVGDAAVEDAGENKPWLRHSVPPP